MSFLFPLLPYFWLLLMVGAILAVIVTALRGRPQKPKKPKKKKGEPEAPAEGGEDGFGTGEPNLDFSEPT